MHVRMSAPACFYLHPLYIYTCIIDVYVYIYSLYIHIPWMYIYTYIYIVNALMFTILMYPAQYNHRIF